MHKECTVYKTAEFIGKRWSIVILLELYKGRSRWKRYSEIKSSIQDITPKILSLRLKELEKEGLILKKVDASSFPIKSEYALTESGEEFIKIIKDLKSWSLKWKFDNKICANARCKECTL